MDNTADFIIVGGKLLCPPRLNTSLTVSPGGTAGLLLANRLASTPFKPSILVIEAGPDRSDKKYRNPSQRYLLAFTHPELDHGYSTVPQVGLSGRQLPNMRARG
jgi:choline dehydrogenase-like flavoprotein